MTIALNFSPFRLLFAVEEQPYPVMQVPHFIIALESAIGFVVFLELEEIVEVGVAEYKERHHEPGDVQLEENIEARVKRDG